MNTSSKSSKKNVFISYRVSDTSGETGRLADALKDHFEEDQIFMDIDKIEPGTDFVEVLSRSLERCDVMLAIIGPNWKGQDANGNPRIVKDDDWVRTELATALKRNIRVVPVLVDGAMLPAAAELPSDLEALVRRQSYEISNKRWRYDTEQLIQFLQNSIGVRPKTVKPEPGPYVPPQPEVRKGMNIWLKIFIGALAFVGFLGVIGLLIGEQPKAPAENQAIPAQQFSGNSGVPGSNTPQQQQQQANVGGNWVDPEGGIIQVQQNGNQLSVAVYHNNQQTGSGSGTVNGNRVTMTVNMFNVATIDLNLTMNNAQTRMSGSLTATANGNTNKIVTILTRMDD